MTPGIEPHCCYCGKAIAPHDPCAILITICGLCSDADDPMQDLFAHSACAGRKFAKGLHRSVPFDIDVFRSD